MRLEKKKGQIVIFFIILIAFLLLLIVEYNEKSASENILQREEMIMEEKIAALLETLDGVSQADVMVTLQAHRELSLEDALEYIADDELMEVTPENVRIRKMDLVKFRGI